MALPPSCCQGPNLRDGSNDALYFFVRGSVSQRQMRVPLALLLLFCLGGVTAWSSSRLFDTSARWWHPPRSSSSAVSLFSLTTSRIKSSRSLGTTPSEESPHLAASIATTATDVTAAPSPVDPFRAPSSRRSLLRHGFGGALLGQVLTTTALLPQQAQARGLVQFPCPHLSNTYHFLRVGQTLLEAQDMWSTNPLFLTVCVCSRKNFRVLYTPLLPD